MNIHCRKETFINHPLCPKGYNSCLQGLHGRDANHTRDIYRCYVHDRIGKFCEDFDASRTERKVNAFIMSWTSFPPSTRFVWFCLSASPHSARRRLSGVCHVGTHLTGAGTSAVVSPRAKLYNFCLWTKQMAYFFIKNMKISPKNEALG